MTKKEIAHLQMKEATLYAELSELKLSLCVKNEYKTFEDEKRLFDDRLYARLSEAWNTVYTLMGEMGVPYLYEEDATATEVERAYTAISKLFDYQRS